MAPLLALIRPEAKLSLVRNCTWTLSNLCSGKPQPDLAQMRPALTALSQLVHSADGEVLTDALWALSYLTEGGVHDRVQAVLDTGVCARVVELLLSPASTPKTPALHVTPPRNVVFRRGHHPRRDLPGTRRGGVRVGRASPLAMRGR